MQRPLRAGLVAALTAVSAVAAVAAVTAAPAAHSASVAPAAASARAADPSGSIVFVRDHDVWIARGDGSGARALTTDGTFAFPYGSPTQSDTGVVVATHDDHLVRLDQQGRVLGRLDPRPLPTSVGTDIDGTPSHAAISPDGTRIAYTFTKWLAPSGGVSAGFRSASAYTAADRLTDPAAAGTTYFWDPSWIGNQRTLQHGGHGSHVNLHDLGSEPAYWFGADGTDFGNTTLSRDGRWLAGILGYDETATVVALSVTGDATRGVPPAQPEPQCSVGPALGIDGPTWGPGTALLWQEADGIWRHPDIAACASLDSELVLPGGSEPHWSPASLATPLPPAIRNTQRPAITGRAAVGTTLRASTGRWSTSGTRHAFRWLRDGRPVAGASGARATYRVTRADRGHRLAVRVTASRSGFTAATATSTAVRVPR